MAESWMPTLNDICWAFTELSNRVEAHGEQVLDLHLERQLRDLTYHLELYIPGLEPVPNLVAAETLMQSAELQLRSGNEPQALALALKGLSLSPHHPQLFFLVATTCIEYRLFETALRLLYHVLWIHPGHKEARACLDHLMLFLDEGESNYATD